MSVCCIYRMRWRALARGSHGRQNGGVPLARPIHCRENLVFGMDPRESIASSKVRRIPQRPASQPKLRLIDFRRMRCQKLAGNLYRTVRYQCEDYLIVSIRSSNN